MQVNRAWSWMNCVSSTLKYTFCNFHSSWRLTYSKLLFKNERFEIASETALWVFRYETVIEAMLCYLRVFWTIFYAKYDLRGGKWSKCDGTKELKRHPSLLRSRLKDPRISSTWNDNCMGNLFSCLWKQYTICPFETWTEEEKTSTVFKKRVRAPVFITPLDSKLLCIIKLFPYQSSWSSAVTWRIGYKPM